MGLGNGNATAGNKGSNHNYDHRQLLALGQIIAAVGGGGGGGALATEGTLISVLNAIVTSDQDIEVLLVKDEAAGNGAPVLKQVSNWETGSQVITYQNVDGSTYVPAPNQAQYVYLDPSAVLNLVLAELIDQGLTLDDLDTKFTEVVRTPGMLRVVAAGVGSVTAGKRSVAVYNYGAATATWLGQTILKGERLTWTAGAEEDTLGAFAYNADTSSLLITWTL